MKQRSKPRTRPTRSKAKFQSAGVKQEVEYGGYNERFIGERIRELRKNRRMTIQSLGAATNLSVGFLSQLERGVSSPSIRTLHEIAAGLGAEIAWFFDKHDPDTADEREFVVRAAHRRALNLRSDIVEKVLSPSLAGKLQLFETHLAPGASSGSAYPHDGEESGVVVEGTIELSIGNRPFVLSTGDSFGFRSEIPHSYRNPTTQPARIVWAIISK